MSAPPEPHFDTSKDVEAFHAAVRDTAYFLWEQDGRPEGMADKYWFQALEQHLRERTFRQLLDDKPGQRGKS